MELHSAKHNKFIVFVYEYLGTAFLLYAINMVTLNHYGVFGIILSLFACLLIAAPITGAHFNPAVTVGIFVCNKTWHDDIDMFLITLFAQFFGAFNRCFASALSLASLNEEVARTNFGVPVADQARLLPNANSATINVFIIEVICTALFVMINLLVKTRKTSPTNDGFLGCMTVALALLVMICVSADKSGACLNPAVGLAQTIYQMMACGVHDSVCNPTAPSDLMFKWLWVYLSAPLLGGLLAGIAQRYHLVGFNEIAVWNGDAENKKSKLYE